MKKLKLKIIMIQAISLGLYNFTGIEDNKLNWNKYYNKYRWCFKIYYLLEISMKIIS